MTRSSFAAHCLAAGLTLAALTAPGVARAMEFGTTTKDDSVVIIGRGEIRSGDAERLVVQALVVPRGAKVALVLNSPGGNVVAGESLAAVVRRFQLPVVVPPGGVCASACFLVFAASPRKAFFPTSRVGVHSASFDQRETLGTMAMTTAMARSASDFGVPPSILGKLVTTAPGDMTWLSTGELVEMGGELLDEPPTRKPPPQDARPAAAASDASPTPSAGAHTTAPATAAPAPGTPSTKPTRGGVPADEHSPSFQQGRADRTAWEQWFATLTGDARLGAEYWTAERGRPRPGNCVGTPDFQRACLAARQRLAGSDVKRKTDPQYWWGWNSL